VGFQQMHTGAAQMDHNSAVQPTIAGSCSAGSRAGAGSCTIAGSGANTFVELMAMQLRR